MRKEIGTENLVGPCILGESGVDKGAQRGGRCSQDHGQGKKGRRGWRRKAREWELREAQENGIGVASRIQKTQAAKTASKSQLDEKTKVNQRIVQNPIGQRE